jgi:undecaprenyl-diphosphatase
LQQNSTWLFVAYRLLFGLVLLLGFRGAESLAR